MKTQSLSFNVRHLLMPVVLLLATTIHAQYGIGTNSPNAQAALHIESANHGLLIPNVTLTNTATFLGGVTPTSDHDSMLVYNTSTATTNNLTGAGFYYWTGGATGSWVRLQTGSTGTITTTTLVPGTDGQVLTTTGTGATASVGWQTPVVATTSHWNVQGSTTPATLNTQDIVQEGDVAVGTATNRKDFNFTGALYGNMREHGGTAAIVWQDSDFAIRITGAVNPLLLPDATLNAGRIIAIANLSGANRQFGGQMNDPTQPESGTVIQAGTGAIYMSDGTTWYAIGNSR